jgi:hypothetical protein
MATGVLDVLIINYLYHIFLKNPSGSVIFLPIGMPVGRENIN